MSERELLAVGFMRYVADVRFTTAQPLPATTVMLLVCLPMPQKDDEHFNRLLNENKAEMLKLCPEFSDLFVDFPIGGEDGSYLMLVDSPFAYGDVSPADLVIAATDLE